MDVTAMPCLEQLPFVRVWFHEIDEHRVRDAYSKAYSKAVLRGGVASR